MEYPRTLVPWVNGIRIHAIPGFKYLWMFNPGLDVKHHPFPGHECKGLWKFHLFRVTDAFNM